MSTSTPLSPRTPSKKKSIRDLNTTTPLGGRPKASGSVALAAAVSLQPPSRSSPGRGLTLRIEENMAEYSKAKAIQSAPIRPVRRLPTPPIPASTINEAPSTTFVSPVLKTDAPPRAKRALPCPPTPVPRTPQKVQDASISAPPVERRRPLPIPILPMQKVETLAHSKSSPALGTSRSLPATTTKIPSPSLIATFPHPDTFSPRKRRHHHSASDGKKTTASTPRKLRSSRSNVDLTVDVIQLHRQYVVDRSPVCISLDCDTASEDEYNEEIRSTAVFIQDVPTGKCGKAAEKELHPDYAWLLSNRILQHPKSSEGRLTCKWMREKKGKRYTEEDFGNILNALRNL